MVIKTTLLTCVFFVILLFQEAARLAEAYFILFLVSYFNPASTMSKIHAYWYAAGLVLMILLAMFLHHGYYFFSRRAGMQMRIAVTGMIYRKVCILYITAQQ